MHELGIVFYVIEQVEKVAVNNNAKKVISATLELGEVSSVIPDYFLELWEWTKKKHPLLTECNLEIVNLKAISYCEDCQHTYDTIKTGKTCPYCGSQKTYLITGNQINLKDIKVI